MGTKTLICLYGNDIAPRFDLTTEVLIVSHGADGSIEEERVLVLPQASPEKLCHMILTEDVKTVICGGIEEEYHQYLTWKRVNVLDSVIGSCSRVLERLAKGTLKSGEILWKSK
jgi:hypothetical protein